MAQKPSADLVRALFSYDPSTGDVFRRIDQSGGNKAGAVVGWKNGNGYLRVAVRNRKIYVHHIAWLLLTGEWPAQEIDHTNGNPSDNRAANLREASRGENNRNTKIRKHSTVGLKGVRKCSRHSFSARITKDGRVTYLGGFSSAAEAHRAYADAASRLHGEFARVS